MNSRCLGLIVFLIVQIAHFVSAFANDGKVDLEVLKRLRTEAVADWTQGEREFVSADVTYRSCYKQGPVDDMKVAANQTYQLVYDAKRGLTLLRMQNDAYPNRITHRVHNPRYDFKVACSDMKVRGTLAQLNVGENPTSDSKRETPTWDGDRCFLMSACYLSCLPLRELLNPVDFEPIEAVDYYENGQLRIRFSAACHGESDWRRQGGIYTAIFDPSHRFRLLSWEVSVPQKESETCIITYHERDDVFTPRVIVNRIDMAGRRAEHTWTYKLPKPCTIPDAEFYLPHYGFSEAVLETLHPNPWPRWLLIGFGIVTIAIGAWLFRGRRQPAA